MADRDDEIIEETTDVNAVDVDDKRMIMTRLLMLL